MDTKNRLAARSEVYKVPVLIPHLRKLDVTFVAGKLGGGPVAEITDVKTGVKEALKCALKL